MRVWESVRSEYWECTYHKGFKWAATCTPTKWYLNWVFFFLSYKTLGIFIFYFYGLKGWMPIFLLRVYVSINISCVPVYILRWNVYVGLCGYSRASSLLMFLQTLLPVRSRIRKGATVPSWSGGSKVWPCGRAGRWCSTRPAGRPGTAVGSLGRWSCRMGLLAPRSGRQGWGRTAPRHHTNRGWEKKIKDVM